MLVTLYADYAKEKLLSFLRSSDFYPIQEALDSCQQRGYIPEMIFLLGKRKKISVFLLTAKFIFIFIFCSSNG